MKNTSPRRNWCATNPFFDLRLSHWTQAILTAALVGLASAQWVIYKRQAEIMESQAQIARGQLEVSKAIDRAFVYFDKANFSFTGSNVAGEKDAEIMAVWGNSGNSPAVRVTQIVGCLQSATEIDEPFDMIRPEIEKANPLKMLFGPHTTNLGGKCAISHEIVKKISDRSLHFYFCGRATYEDTLGDSPPHRTEFCYDMVRIDWREPARTSGTTVGRHNCADKDCPMR